MMHRLLPAFLLLHSILGTRSLDTWPENFIVAPLNSNVNLECGSDLEDVEWTDTNGDLKMRGKNSLRFTQVDQPDAGRYTCRAGGQAVTSTYLFIYESKRSPTPRISCSADSYLHSKLRCAWTQTPHNMPHLIRARAGRGSSDFGPWIAVPVIPGRVVTFELETPQTCPYGEEDTAFTVQLEAVNDHTYISDNRTMFLRDIIKPGRPETLVTQMLQSGDCQLNWTYPASWARPHAYFPLLFHLNLQISKKEPNRTMEVEEQQVTLREVVRAALIKCRDRYHHSEWSDWTKLEVSNCRQRKRLA